MHLLVAQLQRALTDNGNQARAGFASLVVEGDLGGGLFFEQFIDATGVGVVVVPAPGAAGLLGAGLMIASRRRRA